MYIDYFFVNLDLFLSFILCVIYFFNMGLIKNTDNIFASIFFCIIINIFISSLLLTQQIYLGEMILTSILFLFVMIFFLFFINKHIYIESIKIDFFTKFESIIYLFMIIISSFVVFFSVVNGERFKLKEDEIESLSQLELPGHEVHDYIKNTYSGNLENLENKDKLTPQEQIKQKEKVIYEERLAYLNENKFFQRMNDIIIIYLGMILILFFFNWKRNEYYEDDYYGG